MKFGIDTLGGRIDLNLLVVFDAIYESRNLSTAGKRLGLSQPAMSHALGRLRLTFKDPLFVRLSRGLQPTPLANEIAPALIEGLAAIRGGLNRKTFDPATSTRIFNIAMGDPAEAIQLPVLVREFRSSAPHIHLHARQVPAPLLKDALANGDVDMATGDYDLGASVRSQVLFGGGGGASYACVVGANHPQIGNRLTLKQFKAAGHILVLPLGASQHGRNVERTLTSRAVNARIVVRISHFHGVLTLITSTDLIATIPSRLARTMAQYANIKVLPPPQSVPQGSHVLILARALPPRAGQCLVEERTLQADQVEHEKGREVASLPSCRSRVDESRRGGAGASELNNDTLLLDDGEMAHVGRFGMVAPSRQHFQLGRVLAVLPR